MSGMDFKGQAEKLKEVMNKMPQLQELHKIIDAFKPVKQRNIKIEDVDCIISISIDNKVIISFHNEITANKYYEEFVCQTTLVNELKHDNEFYSIGIKTLSETNSNNEKELKKIKSTNSYKFMQFFKRK